MWLNGLCALQDEKNQIMKSNVWLRMVNTRCLEACSCFSALTLLVGRQEEHPACNKVSGGGETICLPADGSSAVAKLAAVRSPHISGSQRAYSRAYSKEFFGVHNFKSSCMM